MNYIAGKEEDQYSTENQESVCIEPEAEHLNERTGMFILYFTRDDLDLSFSLSTSLI